MLDRSLILPTLIVAMGVLASCGGSSSDSADPDRIEEKAPAPAVVTKEDATRARALARRAQARHAKEGVLAVWPDLVRVVELDPTWVDGRVLKATGAAEMRRFNLARAECEAALAIAPTSEKVLRLAANVAFEQGDHAGCVGYIGRIERWRESPVSAWTDRRLLFLAAACARTAGSVYDARACFERLIELEPKSTRYRRLLASHLFDLGLFRDALEANAVLAQRPSDWRAHNLAGRCHERLGDHAEALRWFESAAAAGQPNRASNEVARARCLRSIATPESLAASWKLLESHVAASSAPASTLLIASQVLRRLGRDDEAGALRARHEEAADRDKTATDFLIPIRDRFVSDPRDLEAGALTIQAYIDRRDLANALAMAKLMARSNPDRIEGPDWLGRLAVLQEDVMGAWWEGLKIRALDPANGHGWALLCWSHYRREQLDEAVRCGEKVLEHLPMHGRTIAILADAYGRLGPPHAERARELAALRDALRRKAAETPR